MHTGRVGHPNNLPDEGRLIAPSAIAQDEVVETLDEIVVVGTRRKGRTAIETAVPITSPLMLPRPSMAQRKIARIGPTV